MLEIELEQIQSLLSSSELEADCRKKLSKIHQSISNVVGVMKADLRLF
jgi:hypothetical protein